MHTPRQGYVCRVPAGLNGASCHSDFRGGYHSDVLMELCSAWSFFQAQDTMEFVYAILFIPFFCKSVGVLAASIRELLSILHRLYGIHDTVNACQRRMGSHI